MLYICCPCSLRSDVGIQPGTEHDDDGTFGFINITCTKTLGNMTGHRAAVSTAKVRFDVLDVMTNYLFQRWFREFECHHGSTCAYFFPRQGKLAFNFERPMTRAQHDQAVRRCASALGLITTQCQLRTFTAQSVRVGVSVEVVLQLREALTHQNALHGRARSSVMDTTAYVPDNVLMAPGPLFGNIEEIQARFDVFLTSYFEPIKQQLLCLTCGYPACTCKKCLCQNSLLQAAANKVLLGRPTHSCWLAGLMGRRRKGGPLESVEQSSTRLYAWRVYGVQTVPQWKGDRYGFD